MVFHSDEVNRLAYVPKDWMDELSSQHRGSFIIYGEECTVVSEGKTLCATLNPGTEREILIFSTEIYADPQSKHAIGVTWSEEELCLYFDGEPKGTVKMKDIFD